MQKNSFKSVFKYRNGWLFGNFPVMPESYVQIAQCMQGSLTAFKLKSIRMVVGNKVFEMHTDKYQNVIFRTYEKKK